MKASQFFFLILGIFFVIFLGRSFFANSRTSLATNTFTSEKGSFSIILPSSMRMIEWAEHEENGTSIGAIRGTVWFTFNQSDKVDAARLEVIYLKPGFEGKGGACVGKNGDGRIKKEIIAGQEVAVCVVDNFFNVGYFTHPNKEIEYWISSENLNAKQVKIVGEAIRKTLRFD